eukprot:scaffold3990_cov54-Attheya_sp.AAC.6
MVSIGKAEVGKELMSHLEIPNGADFVFADPENALYDDLDLNSGISTLMKPATAFSFRDRLFKPDGLKDLGVVLKKWNKAVYIPPKQSQAFNQGGTFIFDGARTFYAHYDESTAVHADAEQVFQMAVDAMNARAEA